MSLESWVLPAGALALVLGPAAGVFLYRLNGRALRAELATRERDMADSCRRDSEAAQSKFQLAAREELGRGRLDLEREIAAQRERLTATEARVTEREATVNRQMDRFVLQEADLRLRTEAVDAAKLSLEQERIQLQQLVAKRRSELESLAQLSAQDARTQLLKEIEVDVSKDAADLTRHILEKAKTTAEEQSRRIVATAIQRYAGRQTFETTTATVALSGDDMKGRIIGRDGRNIRAFENATGVTVLVDDTPNAVVLSGFDPVRREIARLAMERLILDGRIHPTRIEEVVAAVMQEMDEFIVRKGEEALFKAGLGPIHPEAAKMLGKLHFRYSFSQNVLEHSIEVAQFSGLMAAELGEDVTAAKRSGLLHDIGKAMTHEIEGPHAIVGADFLKRLNESDVVVNAVASHHDEVAHENVIGVLVAAADAISASRPGSRSESMTTYLRRLENLERLAMEFPGVEKAFAVQAGREIRVIVNPVEVDDNASLKMARELVRRIEDELLYPGQIRVTVIRETRCVEYAK